MIKMGKTKHHYNRKDYAAKALLFLTIPRKGRKFSATLAATTSPWMLGACGRKVRLFFYKRNKKSE